MNNPARWGFVWVVGLVIAGCATGPRGDSRNPRESNWQVSPTSAGPIRLGMTVGQTREAMGPRYRLVDPPNLQIRAASAQDNAGESEIGSPAGLIIHDQFSVRDASGNEVLKFLLSDPTKPEASGNRIVMISVTSARFATPEGVRPGARIADVAAIYGTPALLDDDEEGFAREWVAFRNGPGGIRFEAARPAGDGRLAGIYAPSQSATSDYVPDSEIRALVIGHR